MSFDDVVRSALDTLPPHIAAALRNVAVVVEDENAEDPDLYGLFDGIPLTDGGPGYEGGTSTARGTDILISWAYNEAFRSQGGYAYGLGSAISLLIFFITVAVSLINFRVTGALKEESNV